MRVFLFVLLFAWISFGCVSNLECYSKDKSNPSCINGKCAPCTRDNQCISNMSCVSGVCGGVDTSIALFFQNPMSIALFSTIGAAFVILIMAAIFIWKYMAEKYKRKIAQHRKDMILAHNAITKIVNREFQQGVEFSFATNDEKSASSDEYEKFEKEQHQDQAGIDRNDYQYENPNDSPVEDKSFEEPPKRIEASEKSELQSLVDETITSKEEESESIEDYYKDIIYGVYDDAYENSIANSKNGEEEEEQYSNTSDSFSFRRTSSSASSSSSEDISNRLRSL